MMAAKGRTRSTEQHCFLLQAMQNEMMLIARHLVKEAERERDEYAVQLQIALTNSKVSGTLVGNAKQLPGSSAEGSSKEGHAHPEPGNRADESIGGHPPVPGTGGPASPNSHP